MKPYLLLFPILLFWSCNNQPNSSTNTSSEDTITESTTEPVIENETIEHKEYYVAALSGLRMRKTASLSGEKMDVIPFNTEVFVNLADKQAIKPVSGFRGNMVNVKYGNQEGYMFDGFLSKFPLPQKGQSLKTYVRKLKIAGFEASQTEKLEEITSTQTLQLPTNSFQEAFLVAQRFGWIIGKFDLPNPENASKTSAVDANNIKKTIKSIKVSSAQLEEEEVEIGASINAYKYHLPFLNETFSDYYMIFDSKDNTQWDTFQMIATQEYLSQNTKIERQNNHFLITYRETGE